MINCTKTLKYYISIHALLAESDKWQVLDVQPKAISIHALLAESDAPDWQDYRGCRIISIHALLAESDAFSTRNRSICDNFYPRSPCGERLGRLTVLHAACNFYPRSPCGERLFYAIFRSKRRAFLSTLSLRRATSSYVSIITKFSKFLSTLSLRRATRFGWLIFQCYMISIHALLAESDLRSHFQCGMPAQFLSTLSLRRATRKTQ